MRTDCSVHVTRTPNCYSVPLHRHHTIPVTSQRNTVLTSRLVGHEYACLTISTTQSCISGQLIYRSLVDDWSVGIVIDYLNSIYRWMDYYLSITGNSVVFFAALFSVIYRHTLNPSLIGMALSFAIQVCIYYF